MRRPGAGGGQARADRAARRGRAAIAAERNAERVGRVEEVLVEGPSRTEPAVLRGRTRRNTTVNFAGDAAPGELVPVTIEGATSTTLRGTQLAARLQPSDLVWDGCLNVRDLGGLPTEDGGETRFGAVVRADSVRQLSDDGLAGARRPRDPDGGRPARRPRASDEDPPAELPVEVVHVPFFEAERGRVGRDRRGARAAVAAAPDVADRDARRLPDLPRALPRPTSPRPCGRSRMRREGGVVIHCAGGKDRTGLLAALLLHLAGVADEEIAADYALSEERLRAASRALVRGRRERGGARAAAPDRRRRRRRRCSACSPSSSAGYGGVEGVPSLDVGVSDEELGLVRARLRG